MGRRRRPSRVPLLNARHQAACFARAGKHRDWTVEAWKRVVWSDESRFRLLNPDGRLRILRQAHEVFYSVCQVGTVQGHGGSIMVWGVFPWCCFGSSMHLSMLFGTQSCWVNISIRFYCCVIRTVMEFSSKTTVPLIRPGWLLAG
ncbi:HTH_Tnp_Tc3_2 domain-containing protein [Trichonephila clavipes]|uniref:HTH_Tnp_Tc3_2 domain-containing protein n=1 Tax=Trichonephila clavipes TaxID=2585209 RepID=A0A8X6VLL5_TRICX|nr:HTH_Tnp_Tc3_2 domain-containing protein [Trichonephila clavipes]